MSTDGLRRATNPGLPQGESQCQVVQEFIRSHTDPTTNSVVMNHIEHCSACRALLNAKRGGNPNGVV